MWKIKSQIQIKYSPSLTPEEYVSEFVCPLPVRGAGVEEASEEELFLATVPTREMRGKLLVQQFVLETGD